MSAFRRKVNVPYICSTLADVGRGVFPRPGWAEGARVIGWSFSRGRPGPQRVAREPKQDEAPT